jgi:tRNA pseudouridine32 synthase/23S rRNA pseudouridine746 synthase
MRTTAFAQSRLYLRKLDSPPSTILDHLVDRFPRIPRDVWLCRIAAHRVTFTDGTPVSEGTPYRHGVTVLYEKEVVGEPATRHRGEILYADSEILVVDKPHGIPVTPSGLYVERSLLVQMRRATDNPALTPVHRLDRETAGLVLFSMNPATRGAYHTLFQQGTVGRQYLAVARMDRRPLAQGVWSVETRIAAGEPWFRQRIVPGPPNARTRVELLSVSGGLGFFRLHPETGKKHQLRLHMAHLGFPVLGDTLYSTGEEVPLQLLSRMLNFADPLTGKSRRFQSRLRLVCG